MIGFIVSGHGKFAEGMTSAMELILGKQDNYLQVNFPEEDSIVELNSNFDKAFAELVECENIIILIDLMGGSPFNTAVLKTLNCEKSRIIYGLNLGMLIEVVSKRNFGETFECLLEIAQSIGKEQIGIFDSKKLVYEDDGGF